jgi:peroxiredoxin
LKEIQAKKGAFDAAGIDIVAVSADDVAATSTFIATNGFTIPIASNLTLDMMRTLGLFVSTPKGYV